MNNFLILKTVTFINNINARKEHSLCYRIFGYIIFRQAESTKKHY